MRAQKTRIAYFEKKTSWPLWLVAKDGSAAEVSGFHTLIPNFASHKEESFCLIPACLGWQEGLCVFLKVTVHCLGKMCSGSSWNGFRSIAMGTLTDRTSPICTSTTLHQPQRREMSSRLSKACAGLSPNHIHAFKSQSSSVP